MKMEDESISIVKVDGKSSIESEPRTLTTNQLQYAREAALYVLNTRSIEEAMRIFTEGLKPVMSLKRRNGAAMDVKDAGSFGYTDDGLKDMRDIVTAPF